MIAIKSILRPALYSGAIVLLSSCTPTVESVKTDKLIVWSTESDAEAQSVLSDIEAQFEQKHPETDLVIEIVGWGAVSERLINASRGNDYPDVSHIQPFMAYSLYSDGLLLPFTDIRDELELSYGPILPAVRDLQTFGENDEVYGLAYAVGTTFWSARSDMIGDENVEQIQTWQDYLDFVSTVRSGEGTQAAVTLPGGSPFFIDQLFGELVANAGGRLFDDSKCPALESDEVVQTLTFFENLSDTGGLATDWSSQTYLDQFSALGEGEVFSVPVTYARASKSIAAVFDRNPMLDSSLVTEELVVWIEQPTPSEGQQSVATIDAEPWVIFSAAENRVQENGQSNVDLAKEFLRLYYSEENYLAFTKSNPVHLTPIFERTAESPGYVAATIPFEGWHTKTLEKLRSGATRPIMMPDLSESGRTLPFLLEFQRAGILSGAVSDVIESGRTPAEAAARAQLRARQLVERSGNDIVCN